MLLASAFETRQKFFFLLSEFSWYRFDFIEKVPSERTQNFDVIENTIC